MIITIGGLAGTGTTTTAEGLSEKLDIPYISAGFVFREMAAERGMTVLEFSEFAEGNDDIEIWPFNQPFYLILNCAIGGTLGGTVNPTGWTKIATDGDIETYQDYYYIDWVRVSQ